MNLPAHHQKPQSHCEDDLRDLCCDQDFAFVQPVSERTGDRSERKRREAGGEIYQTKQDCLVGKPAHNPALRHHLHPRATVGNERTNNITAERTLV